MHRRRAHPVSTKPGRRLISERRRAIRIALPRTGASEVEPETPPRRDERAAAPVVTVRCILGGERERQLLTLNDFLWRNGFGLLSRSISTKLGARKAKRPVRRI